MNRWYYIKKWFPVFPGFRRFQAAPFLHPYYTRWSDRRSSARMLIDGIVWGGFQLWAPFRARSVARGFGLDRDWARRASRIARSRFVDPNDIAVFRIASEADADRYLRRFEYAAISKAVNPAAWRADCALADKAAFARRCAAHGLPTPAVLARQRDGRLRIEGTPSAPVVAIKPTDGLGGKGFERVDLPADARDATGFARAMARHLRGRRGDWIVQAWIDGHPDLADIALDALSTARITTMWDEDGEPELVTAVLRFAGTRGVTVDNLASGGLLAPIDPASGRLGSACWGRRPGDVDRHPASGAAIDGRPLPLWAEVAALARDAHRSAFPEYSMIGWDIGIAADGPVLIEGNGKPGLFAAQRASRSGVGETRFGALLAHHLDRVASIPR